MKTVNICCSGGRTSAYLVEAVLCRKEEYFPDVNFVITFANTGREHEKTLQFVDSCDKRWQALYGVGVVWVEAVVHFGERIPSSHKVVDFYTASRKGEPFEDVIKEYGLPNSRFLHCTRELKENPIMSYMESLGHTKGHIKNKIPVPATYETWIGIREDEPKRLKGNRNGKQRKVYPLAEPLEEFCGLDITCDKQDILSFWEDMPFDLDLPEYEGNCIDCHKKSDKKLKLVYEATKGGAFNWSRLMDEKYSGVKPQLLDDGNTLERKRYRGYRNTGELIQSFKLDTPAVSVPSSCETSCEPFMQDNEMLPEV